MFRSAAYLALVLSHVAPHFGPRAEAAEHLSKLGVRYRIDPLLIIADAESETGWDVSAVNRSSGTVGLTQIQPKNFLACREDPEGEACSERRTALLGWRYNLAVIAGDFASARAFCKERIHSDRAIYWLQIIRGYDAVRHARCGHRGGHPLEIPHVVTKLLARRSELEKLR